MFAPNIQETLSGDWNIQSYGSVFLNPYSTTEPFEAGFSLNLDILNDQSYVNIAPTSFLPNGTPIGIGYALAQVTLDKPISTDFNLYAYLDVKNQDWLGMAAMFTFINDKNFPKGLSITQSLKTDSTGAAEIVAQAFGPTLNPDGTMKQPGGIAVFANVKELIADGLNPDHTMVVIPKEMPKVEVLN
jgi:hypothetical protein